ncbi:glycerophosphodiester phosphodiesterase [Cellulomonas carbonis]|uniref:Glycerophosphodiester phosphodiesterase n=1 Tax=Cellulomonas carbonis T26 TaxID=947969 RepID=A0A0A0BSR0_9CELL|nr:glycerophosphodiester phosphodiesterase [Cellulomonas carbonis]KGM10960.1 glycerophosphodiester phosphodiesterase [Cellulomonas carbonis T26]GGC02431.1 glycerophosphoryl diester phosphodiesterase [Cellulomonas carbonis]
MPWYDQSRPPLAIAHRGDHREHVENTLPAIEAAARGGADMIEIDVQLAGDGEVVVVHDATLQRLWGDPRPVAAHTTESIRALGAGDRRIPTLREALEVSRDTGVPLVIDQKTPEAAAAALRVVEDAGLVRATWFCGELAGLWNVRGASAAAQLFLNSIGLTPPDVRVLGLLRPDMYNPEHTTLAPVLVRALHALGIGVSCWTVDDPRDLERLLGMGVDAVMSDDLPTARALVDARDWRAVARHELAVAVGA